MDSDRSAGEAWRALAGVGLGYAVAVAVIAVLVFGVPFLLVVA